MSNEEKMKSLYNIQQLASKISTSTSAVSADLANEILNSALKIRSSRKLKFAEDVTITDSDGHIISYTDASGKKSVSAEGSAAAKKRIEDIVADVEIGKTYEGPVVKLLDFGALVNVLPGKDGLLDISQIAHERVANVSDHLKEGQVVRVKVLEVDDKGRMKLSMKALLSAEAAAPEEEE